MSKHSDQYIYSGYSIGFDRKGNFSFGNGFGRNVIIFGVDMISSVYVDNKKKDILILLFRWNYINSRKKYSIIFTGKNKKLLFKLAF